MGSYSLSRSLHLAAFLGYRDLGLSLLVDARVGLLGFLLDFKFLYLPQESPPRNHYLSEQVLS
jgi:hypothetical protein